MPKFILACSLAGLVVLAANPAISGSPPPPPKTIPEICEENYRQSSADATCSGERFKKKNYSDCQISATCIKDPSATTWSAITVDPANASSVVNCNGSLRLDNC